MKRVLGASGAVMPSYADNLLCRAMPSYAELKKPRLRYSYYAYSKPYTRAPAYFVGMWLVLESYIIYIGVIRQKS